MPAVTSAVPGTTSGATLSPVGEPGLAAALPPGAVPPSPRLSLRRNFSWTLAGNVIYAACQWGMLVALTKLGTREMVGQFAFGLAVTAPIILFFNLQLREVQATDARREFSFADYFGMRVITTFLALVVIATAVFVLADSRTVAAVVLLVALAKATDALADAFVGFLQQAERMQFIAISLVVNGTVSLAAMAGALAATGSVVWACLASVVGSCAGLLLIGHRAMRVVRERQKLDGSGTPAIEFLLPRFSRKVLQRLALLGLPLGLVALLISLNVTIPRYFIEHYLGTRELGTFAAIAYLMTAGTMVVGALSQASSPRLSRHFAAGDRGGFLSLLVKLVGVGLLLGSGGVVVAAAVGPQILQYLYRPEYASAAPVLTAMMVAAGIAYAATFLNSALVAGRCLGYQIPLFVLTCLIAVVASMLLIPRHGLYGAAGVAILTMAIHFIGASILVFTLVLPRIRPTAPLMRGDE